MLSIENKLLHLERTHSKIFPSPGREKGRKEGKETGGKRGREREREPIQTFWRGL
jgi:hypothetical protein